MAQGRTAQDRAGAALYQAFRAQPLLKQIPSGPIMVAVSGGGDSVALLHLLKRVSAERGWTLTAAHIQHRLRGKDSLKDQTFVESLCRKLKVPCSVEEAPAPKDRAVEDSARRLRYSALACAASKAQARVIFTAHHADDQAETLIMRLLRGSGTDGLCGIYPLRPLIEVTGRPAHKNILVVRPLLGFSRADLKAYLMSQKLPHREDRSNRSHRFLRNWVRHAVIPLLSKAQPRLAERFSELAAVARDEKMARDIRMAEMDRKVLRANGKRLDLPAFFRYDKSSRSQWLHRAFPRGSFKEIFRLQHLLEAIPSRKTSLSWTALARLARKAGAEVAR